MAGWLYSEALGGGLKTQIFVLVTCMHARFAPVRGGREKTEPRSWDETVPFSQAPPCSTSCLSAEAAPASLAPAECEGTPRGIFLGGWDVDTTDELDK